jgi:hypothetical protein
LTVLLPDSTLLYFQMTPLFAFSLFLFSSDHRPSFSGDLFCTPRNIKQVA